MCQCDWEKCRKDCKCRCHLAAEAHSNHAYKVGIASGLEQASGIVLSRAQEAFTQHDDKRAQTLRELSDLLLKKSKDQHPGPNVSYED